MRNALAVVLAIALVLAPVVILENNPALAGEISLRMYVVKASSGGNGNVPPGLDAIEDDLSDSGFGTFSLVRCTTVTLPSGASEDQALDAGYSVNVKPTGSSKSATIGVKFYKGTDKVFSGSTSATQKRNAMFVLRRAYRDGSAIIVVFVLK